MLILHDYWCEACGKIERDRMWASSACVENPTSCAFCGGRAHIRYCSRQGGFGYATSLYGKPIVTLNGRQFANRNEKIKFLKSAGLREADDLIGGSRVGYVPPGMDEPADVQDPNTFQLNHMPTQAELDAHTEKIMINEINQGSRKYHVNLDDLAKDP